MKKLERQDMKSLKGGVSIPPIDYYHVPGLVGWIGGASVGYCLCDFYAATCPNNFCCSVPCPVGMCTAGALDPNPPLY